MSTAQTISDEFQLPALSRSRLHATSDGRPFELGTTVEKEPSGHGTVLYLAYGSNLSVEKFRKARGIKPLKQINVQVPSLRLTFDLPGVPYAEPCFANSALRQQDDDTQDNKRCVDGVDEKTALLSGAPRPTGYRKDRWHKGLIGVVYEVTQEDYAHIIATEGGGASYKDIVVDCYPLEGSDMSVPVPEHPTSTPFRAHTLFAPGLPYGSIPPKEGGRVLRPDPSYAQASARYLKLITDGAAESRLPQEYQDYLLALRPYNVSTIRQRAGQVVFLGFWGPILMSLILLSKLLSDKNGKIPRWMQGWTSTAFAGIWLSYDRIFKSVFGEGERTIGDIEDFSKARPGHEPGRGLRRFSAAGSSITLERMTAMQSMPN